MPPGFLPFRLLVNSDTTNLDRLADDRVHWTHACLELRHHHPNIGQETLREAYRKTLEARWEADDPRIPLVFDLNLDFVWGDGLWLDDKRFEPTKVDNDAAYGLPYILMIRVNQDGGAHAVPNPVLRSKAKNRTPSGYRPIRPFRGISFRPNDGYIPLQVEPLPRHKIELLADPMPLSQALAALQEPFPRLDGRYLMACLAAGICADAALGQPPGLACTGTSGSGKEQTIRLGASFVGDDLVKLSLSDSEEVFMRQIGIALTAGHRFLAFDEFGKTRNLGEKLKSVLQISTYIVWRPLFMCRLVRTPVHAAFFYPCVRFPDSLTGSAEFLRRTRRVHLHRKVPNWSETSGGDTCAWRDRTSENAFIANSILTHTWRLCHECGFRFL